MSPVVKHKPDDRVMKHVRKWGVGKSDQKQTPYVRVWFEGYIDWTGWLTPKTMAKTMETLELLGFRGTDLSQLGLEGALDCEREVAAVIDESIIHNGKVYYKAKWINKIGGAGFDGQSKDLLDEFKGFDTRAYIADTQDLSSPAVSDNSLGTKESFTTDDIPF